jgi:membrane associated rhomboid family serine protease
MEIYLLHAPYIIKGACVAAALLPPALGLPVAVSLAIAGALGAAFVLGRLGLRWLWTASPRGAQAQPATPRRLRLSGLGD